MCLFRVQSSGSRVQGLGSGFRGVLGRVIGLWFKGSEFRVSSSVFRVLGLGFRIYDVVFKV